MCSDVVPKRDCCDPHEGSLESPVDANAIVLGVAVDEAVDAPDGAPVPGPYAVGACDCTTLICW